MDDLKSTLEQALAKKREQERPKGCLCQNPGNCRFNRQGVCRFEAAIDSLENVENILLNAWAFMEAIQQAQQGQKVEENKEEGGNKEEGEEVGEEI